MTKICVVGSINMDVMTYVDEYPEKGKTIYGNKILEFSGGKGANQAITCALQGKDVFLIGAVGEDAQATQLKNHLHQIGVNINEIRQLPTSTGKTTIIIDQSADNTLIYVEGANGLLTPEHVRESIKRLDGCSILLVQLETPYDTVLEAMKVAREQDTFVILDPAPADFVTDELLPYADLIVPNEHETLSITGIYIDDEASAKKAAAIYQDKGINQAIMKLGARGAYVMEDDNLMFIPAIDVDAIDSVGAGDCYVGALASAILDGNNLFDAAKYANLVAALKVTKKGAQEGIPTLQQIREFAKGRGISLYIG